MKRKLRYLLLLALVVPLFVSCFKDEEHIDVDPAMLYGSWQQTNGTPFQWTFRSNGTGSRVNYNEFDPDDENNGAFSWTLDRDELDTWFQGTSGLFDNHQGYTIKEITSTSMKWKDNADRTMYFNKL